MDTSGKEGVFNEAFEADAPDPGDKTNRKIIEENIKNIHDPIDNSVCKEQKSSQEERKISNLENKKKVSAPVLGNIGEEGSKNEEEDDMNRYAGAFRSFREDKAKKAWGRASAGEELESFTKL
ncbi:hypothetical protein O0L34_g12134 [Tuta absoluta]|nr:hypothetical protein O0L34_g12134 [Tuta absoluta]